MTRTTRFAITLTGLALACQLSGCGGSDSSAQPVLPIAVSVAPNSATVPAGSTLLELAGHVHREFTEKLKSARIWGTGVFDGQTVTRDHVLHDKDVVELHV